MKNKFVFIVLIVAIVLFIISDFGSTDVEKTSLIIAIGIDKVDEGYEVTSQIAVSEKNDDAGKNKPTLISAVGNTPKDALDNITRKSGLTPNLTFCSVLLLGKDTLSQDVVSTIDFALRDKSFSDTAILVATSTTAKDFLHSKTSLEEIPVFSLIKVASKDNKKSLHENFVNIKDFVKDYNGKVDNYMTYISPTQPESDFIANNILVFKKGILVDLLSTSDSVSFNLLTKGVKKGYYNLTQIENMKNVEVVANSAPARIKLTVDKETARIKCDIKVCLSCEVVHLESDNLNLELNTSNAPNPAIKNALSEKIQTQIIELISTIKQNNCDILRIEDRLFKFHTASYKKYYENSFSLSLVDFNVDVSVK